MGESEEGAMEKNAQELNGKEAQHLVTHVFTLALSLLLE